MRDLVNRDLVNQIKASTDPNYCQRVTANDGELGNQHLRDFQDNERQEAVRVSERAVPGLRRTSLRCVKKATVKLADGKERAVQHMVATAFWHRDSTPMSAQQFVESLFGRLPEFFKDEAEQTQLRLMQFW